MFRKVLFLLGAFSIMMSFGFAQETNDIGTDSRYNFIYDSNPVDRTDTTEIDKVARDQVVDGEGSLLSKLKTAFGVNYSTDKPAEYLVKIIVNYFLAIVAFIALAVLIYGFYMVFLGNSEENLKKARKYIVVSATALIIMGISWFIISMLFNIFFQIRG